MAAAAAAGLGADWRLAGLDWLHAFPPGWMGAWLGGGVTDWAARQPPRLGQGVCITTLDALSCVPTLEERMLLVPRNCLEMRAGSFVHVSQQRLCRWPWCAGYCLPMLQAVCFSWHALPKRSARSCASAHHEQRPRSGLLILSPPSPHASMAAAVEFCIHEHFMRALIGYHTITTDHHSHWHCMMRNGLQGFCTNWGLYVIVGAC